MTVRFGVIHQFSPFYRNNPKVVMARGSMAGMGDLISLVGYPDPQYPSLLYVTARPVEPSSQKIDRWYGWVATAHSSITERIRSNTWLHPVKLTLMKLVPGVQPSTPGRDNVFAQVPLKPEEYLHEYAEACQDALKMGEQWLLQQQGDISNCSTSEDIRKQIERYCRPAKKEKP